jgi:hypothetical protein
LQTPEFWSAFARSLGRDVIGPSTHHYLDEDPGTPATVARIEPSELGAMREAVTPDEWEESGFAEDAAVWFGCHADAQFVAAANLTSYAVSVHGFARWRARTTNRGSLGAAQRLGFEPWCTQLAIR